MTAILAVWRRDGRRARDDGERMLAALRPHGSEHQALWGEGPIALGRGLFRTLPEDVHDRQPVSACGGRCIIVADLRLDNRAELAAALDLAPVVSAGMADSALLGRAWERWDIGCLDRLVGDFAFVVWNGVDHRLIAARDPIGQRPLVYFTSPDLFAVASMPKGLLALPEIPKAVDEERLASQLAHEPLDDDEPIFDTRTFHKGIHRVPPGHVLTVTAQVETLRVYWKAEPRPTLRFARDEEYVEQANEIFDAAVRARLRRIGEVGSHLSSGLDSSAVTVTAARLLAAKGERLFAFTAVPRDGASAVAPPGRNPDEGPLAAEVARRLPNIEHVLVGYPLRSPLQLAAPLTFTSDIPVSGLCNLLWLDRINAEARSRHVHVMLDGLAGNFTLSYEGLERLPILLWQGGWLTWARETMAMSARRRGSVWRAFAGQVTEAMPPAGRQFVRRVFGKEEGPLSRHSALAPAFASRFSGSRRQHFSMFNPADRSEPSALFARRLSLLTGRMDSGLFIAGHLARYRIETRSPASDKRLVDFCLALPLDQFFRNGEPRRLVRRMMRSRLPPDVLAQRQRGYQGAGWLENLHLGRDEMLDSIRSMRHSASCRALLDLDRMERLAGALPREGEANPTVISDYRLVLLRGLSAAGFIRHVEGGNG